MLTRIIYTIENDREKQEIIDELNAASAKARSAWQRGVIDYAILILERAESYDEFGQLPISEYALLDGAADWHEYAASGCGLIYNCNICAALCSPSERARLHDGRRAPNASETWVDVEARALAQAWALLRAKLLARRVAYLVHETDNAGTYAEVLASAATYAGALRAYRAILKKRGARVDTRCCKKCSPNADCCYTCGFWRAQKHLEIIKIKYDAESCRNDENRGFEDEQSLKTSRAYFYE